ncbi:MAG: hypothetical protein PHE78_04820 [Candidatus Gastranaerophilales bacterium]|nr:hypothetical protein [Candidatus Gastranaerophilales bacterium]
MTLITISYKNNDKFDSNSTGLLCVADSLVSQLNPNLNKLTEHSIKILTLDYRYNFPLSDYPILTNREVGFAFSGNVNIAMLTYSMAKICCRNIMPMNMDIKDDAPAIVDLVNLVAELFLNYFRSFGFYLREKAITEICIFGYCSIEKKFKVFFMKPKIENENIKMIVEDIDIYNKKYFSFGSEKGVELFANFMVDKNTFTSQIFQDFLEKIYNDKLRIGVGGFIQKCFVNKGVFLYSTFLHQDDFMNFYESHFCGFNLHNCQIGTNYRVTLPHHPPGF